MLLILRGIGLLLAANAWAQTRVLTVSTDGSADFTTVQAAVDAAPPEGAVIRIQPGTYRQVLTISKPHIQLRGLGGRPQDVVLTFENSAATSGGTTRSASVTVTGDDFYSENLTMENSYSRNRQLTPEGS